MLSILALSPTVKGISVLMDITATSPICLTHSAIFSRLSGLILPNKLELLYNKERNIDRVNLLRSTTLIQLLAQTPPFQGLSPPELQVVGQAAHPHQVERHAFFFHQGDPATNFYILVEGQVRLTQVTSEGHQVLVRFISPGETIGIIA
ncbi:MAG: cyclic nucleotide-binding domain-containing protein, partial [Anaerolineae bacterium]|nr:cyclic nucleotide-binding domain-containing protein [Anaerolineae bacterium]